MNSKFAPPTEKELEAFETSESNLKSTYSPPTEQELKAFEDSENNQSPKTTAADEELKAPLAGYLAGKATQRGIEKTGEYVEKGLEKIAQMGGTSPEQLKVIKENFPEFKATNPVQEVNDLLAQARGTNTSINQMYEQAGELLADKKITPDDFRSLVEKAALEQNKYGQPTFAKPISQSEVSKTLQPAIESTQEVVKSKQEKMLEEFADLKAKEAVTKASEMSLGQLPQKTADQIAKTTKEQVLQNPQAFDFKGMTAQEAFPIFQEQRAKLISVEETPLAEIFPSLKGVGKLDPPEEAAFRKILNIGSADIRGYELQEKLRQLRGRGFTEQGQLSEKPAAATSTQIRKKISELSPEAGRLMEAENVELSKLEALEKAGYIKRVGEGTKTTIDMPDSQIENIVKDLSTSYDKTSPTNVIENIEVLKKYLPEDKFKKIQMAALKLAEKKGGGIGYVNANIINQILQSITTRSVSRGVATLPEAISAALPSVVTKTAKTIGKGALKALPFGGAAVGAIAAQAAEEAASPETSGALPTDIETSDVRNAPIAVSPKSMEGVQSTYWFERGIRDPEEQLQKARLASFKQGLTERGYESYDKTPSAYEKPEVKAYKEKVMQAEKLGALAPTYVEAPKTQVLKADNPAEISSVAQAMQSSPDKVSQEYSRVLSQIVDAPASQKEAVLFGLNQQPAFRELVRKLKDEQKTEEETPLILKGPA